MRRLPALVGLLLVPLLAVACSDADSNATDGSSTTTTTAAKPKPGVEVNATTFSERAVRDELRTIAANKKLVRYFKEQEANLVPRKGTIAASTASHWITSLVHQVFIDTELERKGLTGDGMDRDKARIAVSQVFGGPKVFAAFPKAFKEDLIRRQQRIDALTASFPPNPEPTEADLQAVLTRLQSECPDGKLVSQIWMKEKAEAKEIQAELARGADFATLARERSDETLSGARGGILTCVGTVGFKAYPKGFRKAAQSLPMNEVSKLVPGLGGYFTLKITPLTYDNALPLLHSQFRGSQPEPLSAFLRAQTSAADPLEVNKRFATIVRTADTVGIVPNPAPVKLTD